MSDEQLPPFTSPSSPSVPITPAAIPVMTEPSEDSRRTTRLLVIAAVGLTAAVAVVTGLPGRSTPTVVSRPRPTPSTSLQNGPTPSTGAESPTSGAATGSASGAATGSATGPAPRSPIGTGAGAGGSGHTAAPRSTGHGGTGGHGAGGGSSTASHRPTNRPTPSPPAPAPPSAIPGFRVGAWITVLDRGVLDRRLVATDPVQMQQVSTTAEASRRRGSGWVIHQGLADGGCVSLESLLYPDSYLVASGKQVRVRHRDGGQAFDQQATFCVHSPALDGTPTMSLSPWLDPSRFLTAFPDGRVGVSQPRPERLQSFNPYAALS